MSAEVILPWIIFGMFWLIPIVFFCSGKTTEEEYPRKISKVDIVPIQIH